MSRSPAPGVVRHVNGQGLILGRPDGRQDDTLAATAALWGPPAAAQEEEKVLNVYNWSDYIAEDTLKNFEKETGIKVRYDNFDNNEIVHAKLVAGKTGYDVVVPSSNWGKLQIDGGLLAKIDKSNVVLASNGGGAQVQGEFLVMAAGHQCRQGDHRAGPAVQARPRPDLAPRVAGDQLLEVRGELGRVGGRAVDVLVAEYLPANRHALVVGAHWDPFKCSRARCNAASTNRSVVPR